MAEDDPEQEESQEENETDSAEREEQEEDKKPKRKKPQLPNEVSFRDKITIFSDKPLPQYDVGKVKAYQASGLGKDQQNYFAIVCERHLVPRVSMADKYSGILNPSLVPLAGCGVLFWPPAGEQRYVFIYKDILGKRLLEDDRNATMGWKQDSVMETIVKPIISALLDFRDRDFVHGGIRPSNMFDGGSSTNLERVILGDCLSAPPSYSQPALFETIERSMVDPIARGAGTRADDIYSFGVSLAIMMRSHDPLKGLGDDDVIKAKIELGSYTAITGKDRFKGSILELLRGALHDDPSQRWTFEEIESWLDGRRLSPKQSVKQKRAARPLTFAGKKYFQASLLAMDIDTNPQETLRIVETQELDQWLERSVEDEPAMERVEAAVRMSKEKGTGTGYEERLIANLSTALDPSAPIRYRGLRLMGDGVGQALTEAIVLKQDIYAFAEMFSNNVVMNWIKNQENPNLDAGSLISKFDNCRAYMSMSKIGFGIERCVYLLCPNSHCLSSALDDYIVNNSEELIYVFEDLCKKGKAPAVSFFDRHSTAFLAVKDPKSIEPQLFDLASPYDYRKVFGSLKCLAALQKKLDMKPFPHLARAFVKMLSCVYERYHDRETRNDLKKKVEQYAEKGDLVKMAGLLDNDNISIQDQNAFRFAMQEHMELKSEYAQLEQGLDNKDTFGKSTGKDVAAVVSSLISAVVILVMAAMFFSNKSLF